VGLNFQWGMVSLKAACLKGKYRSIMKFYENFSGRALEIGKIIKCCVSLQLFQRCLIKVLNIDLWKLYLTYVKETKAMLPTYKYAPLIIRTSSQLISLLSREKMAQAYDFTLEKVGMDIQSYSIWNDYVTFLKGVEAVGSYAENQRISAVRKVLKNH
jgi:hypothetical protein